MMVFGTRPEAIKMAPLACLLRTQPEIDLHVCSTGQHREMLDQVLSCFDLQIEQDLKVMSIDQSLNGLSGELLKRLDEVYVSFAPNMVLVHGDTTTSFIAALAAFHRRIPVAHIEAGLRTGNLSSPWPEEANRTLTAVLADLHFAPTEQARNNLISAGIPEGHIEVTGNTVIDALLIIRNRLINDCWHPPSDSALADFSKNNKRLVLITGHRRENFGEGFQKICTALARLAASYPTVNFIYPVHLNPQVSKTVYAMLGNYENIILIPPLDYRAFVWAMDRAFLILTDSGGVQEEAPSLGKPVLVMREDTERPEAVAAGTVRLVGSETEKIFSETARLLEDEEAYKAMSLSHNPYGDGYASQRIVKRLLKELRLRGRS